MAKVKVSDIKKIQADGIIQKFGTLYTGNPKLYKLTLKDLMKLTLPTLNELHYFLVRKK